MRDLQLIEEDIKTARQSIKKVTEFMKDKPFMGDSLKFTLSVLGEKIKVLEAIVDEHNKDRSLLFKKIYYQRSKIDQLHLDGAIKNMLILKESGRLKGTKVEVLEELQRQRQLSH